MIIGNLNKGLIGHWKFDKTHNDFNFIDDLIAFFPFNGNANDLRNGNHGVVNGASLTSGFIIGYYQQQKYLNSIMKHKQIYK